MTNLEKYLNVWGKRVDDATAFAIQLLLDDLANRTQETTGVAECVECMTVDALMKYASAIVEAVTSLREIQIEAKKFIIDD